MIAIPSAKLVAVFGGSGFLGRHNKALVQSWPEISRLARAAAGASAEPAQAAML